MPHSPFDGQQEKTGAVTLLLAVNKCFAVRPGNAPKSARRLPKPETWPLVGGRTPTGRS
jgi:hypothetical protein